MARLFIIHKWHGVPSDDWYGWLGDQMRKRGFEVYIPEMPNTHVPKISEWVSNLSKLVGKPDGETYFVGHSIGCQTVLRYLDSMNHDVKVGGVLLVAGWVNLNVSALDEGEPRIAEPWLDTPLLWDRIRSRSKRFTVIMGADDPYVPLSDGEIFKEKLGARVLSQPKSRHFEKEDGFGELHVALNELLKMTKG